MKYGVRVRVLGDLSLLPKEVLEQVARAVIMSQDNKNALLNVCFAYSSQHEITDAVKRMATGVEEGLLLSRYDILSCCSIKYLLSIKYLNGTYRISRNIDSDFNLVI